jgi:hypothetical protein
MRQRRWRVMLSSTVDQYLVSVQQIMAPTQLRAESRAANLLRARRLMSEQGQAWDRWDLGTKVPGERGWIHVARGDWRDTTWTTRERAPKESVDGIG